MILDLAYTKRDLYTFNQVRSRPMSLLGLRATSLHTRGFCHLVKVLTSTESVIKTVVLIKLTSVQEKSPNCV